MLGCGLNEMKDVNGIIGMIVGASQPNLLGTTMEILVLGQLCCKLLIKFNGLNRIQDITTLELDWNHTGQEENDEITLCLAFHKAATWSLESNRCSVLNHALLWTVFFFFQDEHAECSSEHSTCSDRQNVLNLLVRLYEFTPVSGIDIRL